MSVNICTDHHRSQGGLQADAQVPDARRKRKRQMPPDGFTSETWNAYAKVSLAVALNSELTFDERAFAHLRATFVGNHFITQPGTPYTSLQKPVGRDRMLALLAALQRVGYLNRFQPMRTGSKYAQAREQLVLPVIDGGKWQMVRRSWFTHSDLRLEDIGVMLWLRVAGKKTRPELAAEGGISENTASAILRRLVRNGIVTATQTRDAIGGYGLILYEVVGTLPRDLSQLKLCPTASQKTLINHATQFAGHGFRGHGFGGHLLTPSEESPHEPALAALDQGKSSHSDSLLSHSTPEGGGVRRLRDERVQEDPSRLAKGNSRIPTRLRTWLVQRVLDRMAKRLDMPGLGKLAHCVRNVDQPIIDLAAWNVLLSRHAAAANVKVPDYLQGAFAKAEAESIARFVEGSCCVLTRLDAVAYGIVKALAAGQRVSNLAFIAERLYMSGMAEHEAEILARPTLLPVERYAEVAPLAEAWAGRIGASRAVLSGAFQVERLAGILDEFGREHVEAHVNGTPPAQGAIRDWRQVLSWAPTKLNAERYAEMAPTVRKWASIVATHGYRVDQARLASTVGMEQLSELFEKYKPDNVVAGVTRALRRFEANGTLAPQLPDDEIIIGWR